MHGRPTTTALRTSVAKFRMDNSGVNTSHLHWAFTLRHISLYVATSFAFSTAWYHFMRACRLDYSSLVSVAVGANSKCQVKHCACTYRLSATRLLLSGRYTATHRLNAATRNLLPPIGVSHFQFPRNHSSDSLAVFMMNCPASKKKIPHATGEEYIEIHHR